MASEARRRSLAVLKGIERGRPLAARFEKAVAGLEDERDRALVHELVLGSLRRRGWLDHVLAGLSSRPLHTLAPGVREALRLGAYQLLFTRVAPHAAVSESVELAREEEPRASGFANAVLRRLQRDGPPVEPDASADPLAWLCTAGSLPAWLAERWLAQLGPARAIERARAALEAPSTFVRLNPRVATAREELAAAGVELAAAPVPGAFRATGAPLGPFAERGLLYVQDQGSQLVARLAAAEGLVLDACAAPGGKAMLLSDLAERPTTRVVAAEVSLPRMAVLRRLVRRWGATRVLEVAADALQPPFRREFDSVLLDAPCSGLGTLARNPDIRWRLAPEDVERHAARQRALIASVARCVRAGGRLVYAACSLEPEETSGLVDGFLAAQPGFVREPLPDWARPFAHGVAHGVARDGRLELEPFDHASDGFFAAGLRRL
ncbi:MAG: RsmB/NOP family class I SAM-dependent RNA methyltransferase [Burkholderiales bacterium]